MRFSVLRFRPFFRSVIVTEKFRFFRFGDYCLFCPVSLSVIGKNKIGFSDLLFDAVLCFSGFSSEKLHGNGHQLRSRFV